MLALADAEHRVVVTGDTDFGALLAVARSRSPSVILFRARHLPRASDQAQIILRYLDDVADDLSEGAVVVITDDRIRVRSCRSCTMTDGASLRAVTVLVTV